VSALELLASSGVVPVVVLEDAGCAEGLARALTAGGLPCAEITLRTPAALDALARAARVDGFLAGAGTVLTAGQARAAVAAGARFLVSPGLSASVLGVGRDAGVPVIPGVATATEIMAALDQGLTALKFFPAGHLGGVSTLRALAAPFPTVRFLATGGVAAEAVGPYLALPAVFAVGGSWLGPPELLATRDFTAVTRLAAEAARAARAARALRPSPDGQDDSEEGDCDGD